MNSLVCSRNRQHHNCVIDACNNYGQCAAGGEGKRSWSKKWRSHWSKSNSLQFPAAAVQFHRRPERKCKGWKVWKKFSKVISSVFWKTRELWTFSIFNKVEKENKNQLLVLILSIQRLHRFGWIGPGTNFGLRQKKISSWKALRDFDLELPEAFVGDGVWLKKTTFMQAGGYSFHFPG